MLNYELKTAFRTFLAPFGKTSTSALAHDLAHVCQKMRFRVPNRPCNLLVNKNLTFPKKVNWKVHDIVHRQVNQLVTSFCLKFNFN